MSKYESYTRRRQTPKRSQPHPIWRGIGLIMMVLIPILGYFGMVVLMAENAVYGWVRIPSSVFMKPDDWLYKLFQLIGWRIDPLLYVKIVVFVALIFLMYAVFMVVTFVIYRMFGPSRYAGFDLPPIDKRPRRRY